MVTFKEMQHGDDYNPYDRHRNTRRTFESEYNSEFTLKERDSGVDLIGALQIQLKETSDNNQKLRQSISDIARVSDDRKRSLEICESQLKEANYQLEKARSELMEMKRDRISDGTW
tara:strand:- start:32 stop:379 length:348 start_codon:yes stop_codon:yes gene_type:complete